MMAIRSLQHSSQEGISRIAAFLSGWQLPGCSTSLRWQLADCSIDRFGLESAAICHSPSWLLSTRPKLQIETHTTQAFNHNPGGGFVQPLVCKKQVAEVITVDIVTPRHTIADVVHSALRRKSPRAPHRSLCCRALASKGKRTERRKEYPTPTLKAPASGGTPSLPGRTIHHDTSEGQLGRGGGAGSGPFRLGESVRCKVAVGQLPCAPEVPPGAAVLCSAGASAACAPGYCTQSRQSGGSFQAFPIA